MKFDLAFTPPLTNGSGSLGFAPDLKSGLDWARFGAFFTNPVSVEARNPARGPRCLSFPGGFLLHTGYPNPGLREVLRSYAPRWARSPLPVVLSLLAQQPEEGRRMARFLDGTGGLSAVEVCIPPEANLVLARLLAESFQGEYPLILRLPLDRALELAPAAGGAAAVSLAPPRGALAGPDGQIVHGRLYGPAMFPLNLAVTQFLAAQGLAVLSAGGVYTSVQIQALLSAGALAVQLDAVLWRSGGRAVVSS